MIIEEPGFFYESEVITLTTNNHPILLCNYQIKKLKFIITIRRNIISICIYKMAKEVLKRMNSRSTDAHTSPSNTLDQLGLVPGRWRPNRDLRRQYSKS